MPSTLATPDNGSSSPLAAEADVDLRQNRLQLVLRAARLGTFEYDPETGEPVGDPQARAILGLDADVPLVTLAERVHPDDREAFEQFARRARAGTDGPIEMTYRLVLPDGAIRHVAASAWGWTDDAGAAHVIGTVRDVTERQQAIERAHESEAYLRRVLDGVLAFVGVLAPDGTLLTVNRPALEVSGLRPEDVVGLPFWDCYWWAYDGAVQDRLRDTCRRAAAGEPSRYDVPVRVAGGRFITIDFTINPLLDAEGHVTHLIPSGVDISDRLAAEAALRESEEQFRDMANTAPALLWVTDAAGACMFLSQSWYEYTGQTEAEGLGFGWLDAVHPDDRALTRDEFLKAAAAGTPFRHDYRLLRHDGVYRWALDTGQPRRGPDGTFLGYVGAVVDIHDRKEAGAALLESEARYRLLFESIDVGFCVLEMVYDEGGEPVDYRFVETNPAFVEQTGLIDAVGRTAYEMIPGLERKWVETYGAVAETGEPVRFVSGSDAMDRWFDVYAVRVGEAGSRRVALLFSDITERRKAEALLRDSEERYRALFESIDVGFCALEMVYDEGGEPVDYRFVETNPAFVEQSGLSDVVGRVVSELVPNFDRRRVLTYSAVAETGEPVRFVRTAENSGRSFEVYVVRLGATPGRRVAVLSTDITERFAAETALRESEERFRGTFENAAVGIAHVGPAGSWLRVNERLCEIVGYSREELVQRTFQDITHPADLDADVRYTERVLQGEIDDYHMEKRYVHRDGHSIWVHLTVSAVRTGGGELDHYISVVEDITSRKEAEAALRALNDELEDRVEARTAELARSNAELDQFAYVASHDLKAPLRAIDSLATWIEEDAAGALPAESARHLALLRNRVQRMENLLDSLLTYSRAGRTPVAPETVDTAALVHDVVALVAPPVGFDIDLVGDFPEAVTARAPLELVFRNLISNAVKHHDRSGGHVTVTAQTRGDRAEFAVADDGPGIDPQYHDRVFGLFQTLRPRDEVEGSGMGLAIVKKTVEGQGGQVTVDSGAGRGTTFRFTWPLRTKS